MRFIGFKRVKPRQFDYIPRYYDAEREERENRRAMNDPDADYKPGSLVRGMSRERYQSNDINAKRMADDRRRRMMIRMVLVLIMLFTAAVMIMNSTVLEEVFGVFMQQ